MNWSLIRGILILPGTALVYVPALILWAAAGTRYAAAMAAPADLIFWVAILLAAVGLGLGAWTASLFMRFGAGTPAPWDPPTRFVVRGPYRHLRNPMIGGVLIALLGEALFFRSWPLAAWMLFFLAANMVYFPLSEEKGLEKRFGDDYRIYKANVRRWIPRLRPWRE